MTTDVQPAVIWTGGLFPPQQEAIQRFMDRQGMDGVAALQYERRGEWRDFDWERVVVGPTSPLGCYPKTKKWRVVFTGGRRVQELRP